MKQIQEQIDRLAKRRKYWRELSNALGASTGSPVVDGLVGRITAQLNASKEDLRVIEPTDSIGIARKQAECKTLEDILLDFDLSVCHKNIEILDRQIAELNEKIKSAAKKKREVTSAGFEKLIGK